MVTPAAKRKAVAHLMNQHGMSERRACKTMGCCRMTIRYETARGDDRDLRERMKTLAHERRRFGYRRLHVLLRREGHLVNHKKLFRLYREEKLTVRKRGGRKRAIGTRAPMLIPMAANDRWSLDFVSDQLTDGRRFRVLTVVDRRDAVLRSRNKGSSQLRSRNGFDGHLVVQELLDRDEEEIRVRQLRQCDAPTMGVRRTAAAI